MKVVTSFLALWLLCGGVQGEECVAIDNGYYWDYEDFDEDFSCGCQIQDANGEPVFNVSLDFIDKKYVFITAIDLCDFLLKEPHVTRISTTVIPHAPAIPIVAMRLR